MLKKGLSRSQIRRLLFAIKNKKVGKLDRDDKRLAEEVFKEFNGYLLGSIGWLDFTFKWDIHPNIDIKTLNIIDKKLPISQWTEKIISLFEWKEWLDNFKRQHPEQYKIPPACFTRQG